jgi:hypothetical protein
MSVLGDIESGVLSLIGAIQSGGDDAFATVGGAANGDRQAGLAALDRLVKPAALVVFADRGKAGSGEKTNPRFEVWIGASSHRGGDEPRLGGTGVIGGFELAELVSQAMHRAIVATDHRVRFLSSETLAADTTTVTYRQQYEVAHLATTTPPTFDGIVIAGSGSDVEVVLGPFGAERVAFGFPGIRGSFVHDLGLRDRVITWAGILRAADQSAMNTLEAGLFGYAADPRGFDLADGFGRTQEEVVLEDFERTGSRGIDPINGEVIQPFVLTFRQLFPA